MIRPGRRQLLQGGLALAGLSLCSACGSLALPWQQPTTLRRIAYLSSSGLSEGVAAAWSAFRDGLRDLGYVEGQNLLIDERHGDYARPAVEPAADLVRRQMEVIVVPSITVARAVRAATTTIPIVSAGAGDLVGRRPCGQSRAAWRQRHRTEYAIGPGRSTAAIAQGGGSQPLACGGPLRHGPADTSSASRTWTRPAAWASRCSLSAREAPRAWRVPSRPPLREHADSLIAANSPLTSANQTRIAELALQRRLATMFQQSEAADRGALLTYSPNRVDLFRRAATYVDKILKGAKPADLPIEQPTTYDFVVNLKAAQTLGLTIPPYPAAGDRGRPMRRQSRRDFLGGSVALAGLGLLAGCGLRLPWQQPKIPRIGYLGVGGSGPGLVAFVDGLRDLGYVEGQTIAIEWRWTTTTEQLPGLAADLVSLRWT